MKLAFPAVILAVAAFGSTNAQQMSRRRVETVDPVEESPEAEVAAIEEDPEGYGYGRRGPCCSYDFATCASDNSFCNSGPHQCEIGCAGHWLERLPSPYECVPLWGTCYPDFGRPCVAGDMGCRPCPEGVHGCKPVDDAALAGGGGGYGAPCVAGDGGCSPCPSGPHGCHPVPPPPRCCGPDPIFKRPPPPPCFDHMSGSVCTAGAPGCKCPPPPCHDVQGAVCTAGAPGCNCGGPPCHDVAGAVCTAGAPGCNCDLPIEDPNDSGYSNGYKGGYWYNDQGFTACSVNFDGYSQCVYYDPPPYYGGASAIAEDEDADIVLAEFSMAEIEADAPKRKGKARKLRH